MSKRFPYRVRWSSLLLIERLPLFVSLKTHYLIEDKSSLLGFTLLFTGTWSRRSGEPQVYLWRWVKYLFLLAPGLSEVKSCSVLYSRPDFGVGEDSKNTGTRERWGTNFKSLWTVPIINTPILLLTNQPLRENGQRPTEVPLGWASTTTVFTLERVIVIPTSTSRPRRTFRPTAGAESGLVTPTLWTSGSRSPVKRLAEDPVYNPSPGEPT